MYFYIFKHRIKKGNSQGHFDKFCYGFVTMSLAEKEALSVMNKITEDNPTWKLKIKEDGHGDNQKPEKYNRQNNFQQPQQNYQQNMYQMPPPQMQMPQMQQIQPPMISMPPQHQVMPSHQPQQTYTPRTPSYNSFNATQQPQNDKGQIYGVKKNRIMVRELWLGGIP